MCNTCYGHQIVTYIDGKPVPVECPECHDEERPNTELLAYANALGTVLKVRSE